MDVAFKSNGVPIGSCNTGKIPRCQDGQCCISWVVSGEGPYVLTAEVDPLNTIHERCEPGQNPNPACRHVATTVVKRVPARASIIVIDQSGSMRTDPEGSARTPLWFAQWGSRMYIETNFAASENGPGDALALYHFHHQVFQDLPLRYMDPGGKQEAYAANTIDHGGGGTFMYSAMWDALDEACDLETTKGMIVLSDGMVSWEFEQRTATEVTQKAIACQTPFLVSNPMAFVLAGLAENFPWPDSLHTSTLLKELAVESGGGFYIPEAGADTAFVRTMMGKMSASLEKADASGWLVSPLGDAFVTPGESGQIGAGVNIAVVDSGLSLPDTVRLTAPAGVTFAGLPTVQATNMTIDAGGILISNFGRTLNIPVSTSHSPAATAFISVGSVPGVVLDVGLVAGDIDFCIDGTGGGPFSPDTVTLAYASSDVVVRTVLPMGGGNSVATPVTITGNNFIAPAAASSTVPATVSSVELVDAADAMNVYSLTAITVVSTTEINATVPAGVPPGFYHVSVDNGSTANQASQTLFLVRDVVTAAPELAKPDRFALYQNTPNPFNPVTTITFDIPQGAHVSL